MKANYVQAVLAQLEAGQEPGEVVAGLVRTLKARGHSRLLKPVLTGTLAALLEQERTQAPKLTLATAGAAQTQKQAIAAAMSELKATTEPTVTIDEAIVGGFILEHNHTRLDNSYKTKLVELYRSITK